MSKSISTEKMDDPIVIKTESDNNDLELNSELKTLSKPNVSFDDDSFLCSICQKKYTDQEMFFDHLESHYLPERPEHFQCRLCQETSEAQVDFYIHVRVHYKPSSMMSQLGSSITVLLKLPEEIKDTDNVGITDIFNDDDIDNEYSDVSYVTSFNANSDTDDSQSVFDFEEGRHFKQEMKHGNSFSDQNEATDANISNKEYSCPDCSTTEIQPSYQHFLNHHKCKQEGLHQDTEAQNQNKGHMCDLCHKWFPQLNRLMRHKAMHASARPFACIKCHKSFKTKDALDKHLKSYKDGECIEMAMEKPYACDKCGAKYQLKRSLQRHSCLPLQHKIKNNVVRKKSDNDDNQNAPAGQRVHTCEKCGATYQTSGSLRRHFLNHHSGVQRKVKKKEEEEEDDVMGEYSCEHCQLKFTLKRFLKTHMCHELRKVAEKTCQCDQCGRAFSSNSQLNRHRLGHMKERPFKCTECPKAFFTETEHKKHMTFHNGEEIQCEFCEQVCKGAPSYKLHVKRKHRYNLECELCHRKFSNRPSMRTHMRTHTNEKPFVCSKCGLSFHSLSGLSNHNKNIHTDFRKVRERSYVCHLCGKGFFSKCRLKVHTESHNEVRDHLCTECGSGFKCKADLKRHMERHSTPEIPCLYCNLLFTCKSNLRKHVDRRHKHVLKVPNRLEDSV